MPFTKANGHSFAMAGALASIKARKARPPGTKRLGPRSQVLLLKDIALRDAISKKTPVGVRASLMRAYVDLHEIYMAITGQGKPRPVIARNDAQSSHRKPRVVAPLPRRPKPEPPALPVSQQVPLSPQKDNASTSTEPPAPGSTAP
jgi:hypothetical protein